MTSGPTEYPSNWPGARSQTQAGSPSEALQLCIDAYVSALSPEEFNQLVARTRG